MHGSKLEVTGEKLFVFSAKLKTKLGNPLEFETAAGIFFCRCLCATLIGATSSGDIVVNFIIIIILYKFDDVA